ncbi:MAG: formate dehydrogenase [Desulfobacterales bacterium]|nr:MAG: formate dehydrogenase [Desulfobacterales bacterium]
MNGKSFFVDLTLCTACRGCQVACKQWKDLPAERTHNFGSHQNPADLSHQTIRLVRFKEARDAQGKLRWYFFPEQCRHCIEPPCKYMLNMYKSAVVYNEEVRLAKNVDLDPQMICPYNVPRKDAATGHWRKCDMCIDRVKDGLKPACVTSCPTGTMNFGDREAMLEMAQNRLTEVKKTRPNAFLADPEDVRVIYLCDTDAENYHTHMVADTGQRSAILAQARPAKQSRREFLTGRFNFGKSRV